MGNAMIFPQALKPGDLVGLVTPSSPISPEEIRECKNSIEGLGFHPVLGDGVRQSHLGYLSGKDEVRAQDINKMFKDPRISGIFCIRGGYGASRIIDQLDLKTIRENPKVFVGYSDISVIHLVLNQQCNLITFHGPMVLPNMISAFDLYSRDSFIAATRLKGELKFKNPPGKDMKSLIPGKGAGRLVGGNLSTLATSIGTPYEIDTRDKVLFLEEIGEVTYKIDRLLWQFKNAGKLEKVQGILLGSFDQCLPHHQGHALLQEVFKDILGPLKIPTLYKIQVGHGHPTGTLPLGAYCQVDATNREVRFSCQYKGRTPALPK